MRRLAPQGAERRGAVLPLVCILLVVLLGAAALGIDLARLYYAAQELQTAADAAALAGASAMQTDAFTPAWTTAPRAQQVAALNRAAGQAGQVVAVQPLFYNPATRASTPASYGDESNALQVTVRATPNLVLGGAMGLTPRAVTRTATAWIANVNGAECMRSFAIPYTRIIEDANGRAGTGYSANGGYAPDLEQSQVAVYSANYRIPLGWRTFVVLPPWQFKNEWDPKSKPSTGSWRTIDFTGGNTDWTSFVRYMGAQPGSSECAAAKTRVGDYLRPFQWNRADTTSYLVPNANLAFAGLCNFAGDAPDASCRDARATTGVKTRVAMYDSVPTPGQPFVSKVRMTTQVRIMCYFRTYQDTCPATMIADGAAGQSLWQMPPASPGGPPVTTGYPPGTVVVLVDSPASVGMGRDVELGNTVGFTQRLVLVK